jgi:hypothetical protein
MALRPTTLAIIAALLLLDTTGAHALKCRGTPEQVELCVKHADARARRYEAECLGRTEARRLCWLALHKKHDVPIDDAEGKRKVRLIPIP